MVVCYDLKIIKDLSIFGDLWIYKPLEYNMNKELIKISFNR